MESKTKKRIIIWTSVAVVLGVGGYFLVKYLKDKGIIGKKDTVDTDGGSTDGGSISGGSISGGSTSGGSTSGGSTSGGATTTAEQTALAVAYRIWANSTDELSKKYGKKSSYDLDASSSNPYGGTFLRSYAAGKSDYEKSIKGNTTTINDQIEQITKIAAKYPNTPILADSKGGQYVNIYFGAKFQDKEYAYRLSIYEKSPYDGAQATNGYLVWILSEANWYSGNTYENRIYQTVGYGLMRYDKDEFVGVNSWGRAKGGKGKSKIITEFVAQATNNQIYGLFDTSKLK
jgi:hypothetical protein